MTNTDSHITCPSIPFPHRFLSNESGVSSGVYTSLNCGPGSHDAPENIAANRRKAAQIVSGAADTPLLSLYQIHSNIALPVTSDWRDARPKADAMVTKETGIILGILTADCTPVLFADPHNNVIGAAHAGWKGALTGILENTVNAMIELGAEHQHIIAAIGPTIHAPSYEVTAEFRETFLAESSEFSSFFTEGKDDAHFQFNLPDFVENRLSKARIRTIWNSAIDTYQSKSHFSFRRTTHKAEHDYGRQLSAIMLP